MTCDLRNELPRNYLPLYKPGSAVVGPTARLAGIEWPGEHVCRNLKDVGTLTKDACDIRGRYSDGIDKCGLPVRLFRLIYSDRISLLFNVLSL